MSQNNVNNTGASGDDTLAVLGGAGGGGPPAALPPMLDAMDTGTPKRSIRLGPVVTAVAILAGAGMLVGMRQLGLGPKFAAADDKLASQIPQQSPMMIATQESLLAEIGAARTTNQVPPDKLRKNPFIIAYAVGVTEATQAASTDDPDAKNKAAARGLAERMARERADREKNIKSALEGMKLQGVMGGRVPLARINGEVYRVGDSVGKYFVVKSIAGRSAEIEADGKVFVIEMAEGLK